jgi:hypothetical protein
MARIPSSLSFIRPLLHSIRNWSRKFLGLDATGAYALPGHFSAELPVGETFQRVMDRICLLESQVNWRLYGMPAAVGNVKLEQAGILANGLELENLVEHLAQVNQRPNEVELFLRWCGEMKASNSMQRILVVPSWSLLKDQTVQKALEDFGTRLWFIADVEDLYLPALEPLLPRSKQIFRAPLLSVLSGFASEELSGVWVSDAHVRMHPLKWLLTLQQLQRTLALGGITRGMVISDDMAARDVRCLKQLDPEHWAQLSSLGELKLDTELFEIKK